MKNNNVISNKLYKLEALRGFAAVYVVFYHLFASGLVFFKIDFSFLFRFGQEAVILFFILSGFVIYYSFEKAKNKSLKLFFTKRFLRIYIPLIIVFILNYCLYYNSIKEIDIKELIGNLLMLQDSQDKKPNVIVGPFLGNIPLWSLSYEWYFYFIFIIIYKKANNSSIIVYLLSVASSILYIYYPNFFFRELMYFAIWWTGVDIAKLYINHKEINFKNIKLMLFSLFIICLVLLFNVFKQGEIKNVIIPGATGEYPWLEFRHFLFTILIISFAVIWKKMKWIGFDIIFKPFAAIAPISFGIYISHWFLVFNTSYISFIDNRSIRLTVSLLICVLFSYFLELKLVPFIRKKLIIYAK